MSRILVAGIGTEVGKTVVSAILTTKLQADYWKPFECVDSDTKLLHELIDTKHHRIFTPAFSTPKYTPNIYPNIQPPKTSKPLIIESMGGILVPLNPQLTTLDLYRSWDCEWVIVSRHYLGSINHTLMTVEILQKLAIPIKGLIFNGEPEPEKEQLILEITKLPLLGQLLPEPKIDPQTIKKYAKLWKQF